MQTVVLKLLPDGTGRIRIHWAVRDPNGKIEIRDRVVETSWGPKVMQGARWRVVCQPGLSTLSGLRQGENVVLQPCSDDPRGVTCPECMAAEEFQKARQDLEELAG